MEGKKYQIGGRNFYQTQLTIPQWRQLAPIIMDQGIKSPRGLTSLSLLGMLGEAVPALAAVILREEGKTLKEKNLEELTAFLEENLSAQSALEVAEDFFTINPMESFVDGLGRIAAQIGALTVNRDN